MDKITALPQWMRFSKRAIMLRAHCTKHDFAKGTATDQDVDCCSLTTQNRKGRYLCPVSKEHFDFLARAGYVFVINNRPYNKYIDYAVNAGFWDAVQKASAEVDIVNNAPHYGGKDNPYEVVKVLEAWELDKSAYLWNTVKYIARSGKKTPDTLIDLKKAEYYLKREIANREKGQSAHG